MTGRGTTGTPESGLPPDPPGPESGTTTGTQSGIGVGTGAGTVPGNVSGTPGAPITGAAERPRDDSARGLREEIEQTRHELGETVAALAAKTDVKAQAKGMARHWLHPMEERARRTGRLARDKGGRLKDRAVEAAESEQARTTARRGGLITAAAAGLALLGLGLLRYRRAGHPSGWPRIAGGHTGPGGLIGVRRGRGLGVRVSAGRMRGRADVPGLAGGRGLAGRRVTGRHRGRHIGGHGLVKGRGLGAGRGVGALPGVRKGRMGARPGMLGGTRRIAPGLHVRGGRGVLTPRLLRSLAGPRRRRWGYLP